MRTLCALLLLVGCQGRSDHQAGPSAVGSGAAVVARGPTISLVVDGEPRGALSVAAPRPLAELLPEAVRDPVTWTRIEANATGRRFLDLEHPARTYPDGTLRVFLDARGRPSLGVFRPVRDGLPPEVARIAAQPSPQLVDVTEIRVRTRDAAAVAGPALTVELPGLPAAALTEADLAALGAPLQGKQKMRGWALAQVVALRGPAPAIGRVLVEDRDGAATPITAAELAAPGAAHLLRVNKRGQWVFEAWAPDGTAPAVKVPDVVRVRVEPPGT